MDLILDAPAEERKRLEPAGFWIRVASFIIDYIVIQIIIWVVAFLAADQVVGYPITIFFGIMGIYITYFVILETSELQGTLGKLAVGIKVCDKSGDRITFANSLGRTFSKFISFMFLGIGFMMVGWDDFKQGLHDKMADTYVFYK
jgi:uncharacterized RDD family membrane protein YckC